MSYVTEKVLIEGTRVSPICFTPDLERAKSK